MKHFDGPLARLCTLELSSLAISTYLCGIAPSHQIQCWAVDLAANLRANNSSAGVTRVEYRIDNYPRNTNRMGFVGCRE